jgi:hypothetical protein
MTRTPPRAGCALIIVGAVILDALVLSAVILAVLLVRPVFAGGGGGDEPPQDVAQAPLDDVLEAAPLEELAAAELEGAPFWASGPALALYGTIVTTAGAVIIAVVTSRRRRRHKDPEL